jgi:Protein of unknown function (DUF3311)
MSGAPTPPSTITPLRLFATFCVLAPTVAVIAVPTYNSATPRLAGFPFFYWYQLLLVVLTGILMVAAFWAIKIDEGRRKRFKTAANAGPAGGGTQTAAGQDEGAGA